ncbi:MAG: CaiB/BaiF CoA transferase family protein [Dehalococcoidia bacterium]
MVEFAGAEAGAYCAKLFADLGAKVIKVEPPGGDPRRLDGERWGEIGTTFAYLNTSKTAVELDPASPAGRGRLRELLDAADVLVESSAPEPLQPLSLGAGGAPPRLVRVAISPFGLSGPYSGFRSNTFTDDAIGGHLYLNGEPRREPIRRPGLHTAYQAGTQAFVGAMAALLARERTGAGQAVEVSHFEGIASLHQHTVSMWTHGGFILRREGNRQPGLWHPVGVYRCKDGYVQLSLPSQRMVEPFLLAAGLGSMLQDSRFADDYARGTHKDQFDAAIEPWLMAHTVEEVVALGQAVHTPVGPVPGMLEVSADDHLGQRGYWVTIPGEPSLRFPRGPFQVEGHITVPVSPPAREAQPAPAWTITESGAEAAPATPDVPKMPLEGVRVLDLTRVWAGPLAGRFLADLGADVIAVEMPGGRGPRDVPASAAFITHLYPENDVGDRPWNRAGGFNKLFRNRRGITLDLKHPRCAEIFAELIRGADVLLENYSPRVMAQLGFDDETLRRLNPHIIHAAMPGYGRSGPKRDWVAFGPLIEASAGLTAMMGYTDSGPYRSGIAWPDPVSGMNAAAGVLVALWDREADPERRGRNMEMAMIEAMGAFVGEELLAAQVRGSDAPRRGNRDPRSAPQGCYPCAGADRWVAISVTDDAAWRALCDEAGLPGVWRGWALSQRLEHHDEVDEALAAWTRGHTPHELMRTLQARGVAAVAVSDARDLVEDPHLAARGFWARQDHPEVGPRLYPGNAIRLSETPVQYRRPAPTLGQHNDEILHGELGVSRVELTRLREGGFIAEVPPPR